MPSRYTHQSAPDRQEGQLRRSVRLGNRVLLRIVEEVSCCEHFELKELEEYVADSTSEMPENAHTVTAFRRGFNNLLGRGLVERISDGVYEVTIEGNQLAEQIEIDLCDEDPEDY